MKVQIVLSVALSNDAQLCIDSDDYTNAISAASNPNFAAPAVSSTIAAMFISQVAAAKAATVALRAAIAAQPSITRNDTIRTARAALESQLTILANLVENVANAPSVLDINREGIVHSAMMKVKAKPNRGKKKFEAMHTELSGSIRLVAEGSANAHLWEYTEDIEKYTNRISTEPTTVANTIISGLVRGTEYALFHKAITPNGPNVWEGPVFITAT